ncbi:MAG: GPW/gp25 family protein [Bacteroidales bacterium]|nr:GPW/gp25 family protein [Bacteroidales bacterium]
MAIRQRYGIAFPITIKSGDGSLFDTSDDLVGCVTSEMMHVLFTPKGQRLRDPEFGTELIQYIFNPNDSQTWADVKHEIKSAVSRYVPDCSVNDVEIAESEDGRELYAKIKYSVNQYGVKQEYETITRL